MRKSCKNHLTNQHEILKNYAGWLDDDVLHTDMALTFNDETSLDRIYVLMYADMRKMNMN